MAGEMAKGQMHLALVRGFDAPVQTGQVCGCSDGVGIHGQNGQRQGSPSLHQTFHGRCQRQASGQQNAGDIRIGIGKAGGQCGQDDIRPIPGRDDQMAILQIVKEVAHLHGRDEIAADQIVKMFLTMQHLGVQPGCDILHTGLPKRGRRE